MNKYQKKLNGELLLSRAQVVQKAKLLLPDYDPSQLPLFSTEVDREKVAKHVSKEVLETRKNAVMSFIGIL